MRLSEALHSEIMKITDKPIKLVINENGQGHAILGNKYWSQKGIDILAHEDAIFEIEENSHSILQRMKSYNKDRPLERKSWFQTKAFRKNLFTLGGLEFHVFT